MESEAAKIPIPFGITAKIVSVAIAAALVAGAGTALIGLRESSRFADAAGAEAVSELSDRLNGLARSAADQIDTADATLQEQLERSLTVGEILAAGEGGFRIDPEGTHNWTAVNQFDKSEQDLELPKVMLGSDWIIPTESPSAYGGLVDEILDLTGAISTVFQRMPDDGMLRVSTNVATLDNRRAIGTYIPKINPDGTANGVVNTLLAGDTFRGSAFVVNQWYLTVYAPIFDFRGEVIGSLFVGIPQQAVAEIREALLSLDAGENGSVEVYRTKGIGRGEVVMSSGGELDGQNLIDAVDPNGVRYVEEFVTKGPALEAGEVALLDYVDQAGNVRNAHYTYYEPWDWVLVIDARESDAFGVQEQLIVGRESMRRQLLIATGAAVIIAALLAWLAARAIARPLTRSAAVVHDLATSETGLARSSSAVAEAAEVSASEAKNMESAANEVRSSVRDVEEAVVTVTQGMDSIATSVGGAAMSLAEMTAAIQEVSRNTTEATSVADQAVNDANNASARVRSLSDASAEVEEVVGLIASITEQTKLLALNATIEAARAGEAGKGFAVVADEVKQLAELTADSSERIAERVRVMRAETAGANDAIDRIEQTILSINDLQMGIAGALEEQSVTTASLGEVQKSIAADAEAQAEQARRIATQAEMARRSADSITTSIGKAADSATTTTEIAAKVEAAADALVVVAADLSASVG